MGIAQPKQYLPLAGRSLLEWSLAPLLAAEWIDGVVIALARGDSSFARLPVAGHARLLTVQGGSARADSVLAGLKLVTERAVEPDNVQVLVHDAARPCLHVRDLQRLRDEADERNGALLAVPSVDTLKRGESGKAVATVDRSHYWRAQTPQLFPLLSLTLALRDSLDAGITVTDEASAMERRGLKPRLVRGHESNLKVTYPDDLRLAEFWLAERLGQP